MIFGKNIAAIIAAMLIASTLFGQNPVDNTAPTGAGNVISNDGGLFFGEAALWWDKNNDRLGIARAGSANNTLDVGGSIRAIGTGIYTAVGAPVLRLENSTASTGRPYYFLSSNTGDLELYSTPNVTPIFTIGNLGDAATAKRLVLGQLWGASSSGNMLLGRNSAGGLCRITLGAGLTLTDSTLTASGGGSSYYQTVRDNGTARTQRGKLNLLSTAQIVLSATDDSGNDETEVAAALAQNGATTGQVMAWNGTTWAPAAAGAASFNIISPAQITARADDWNPTGFSTADLVRLSGDNSFEMITGLAAPASGKRLTLTNVGTFAVLLTKEDANSTAANRLALDKDFTLSPNCSIELYYDLTSARWKSTTTPNNALTDGTYYELFGKLRQSNTSGDYNDISFATSGTGSGGGAGSGVGANPGLSGTRIWPVYFNAYTGSTATGGGAIVGKNTLGRADNTAGVNTAQIFKARIGHSFLSDGTNTFTTRVGLLASMNASGGDESGVYFRYTHSENSGQWVCVTRNGASETVLNTSIAIATADWYDLMVCLRPDGTAAFFINDVLMGTNANTNFPDNTNLGFKVGILKSAGTTSCYLNCFGFYYSYSNR